MAAVSLTGEQERLLLTAATAAPSTYNTQPWRFVVSARHIELNADPSRHLLHIDPEQRELHISCGAALLNLRLAAGHLGMRTVVSVLPDRADPGLLATVDLESGSPPDETTDALYHAISRRHTHRGVFENRPVPGATLAALAEAARDEGARLVVPGPAERRRLIELALDAERDADADPEIRSERARWISRDPARGNGVPVGALGPLPAQQSAPVRDLARGIPVPGRHVRAFETRSTVAVLATHGDDPQSWLAAGQALERVLLTATVLGVSASFFTQPLERPHLRWLARDPSRGPEHVQMLMRLGFPESAHDPAAGRRPAAEVTEHRP